MELIDRAKKIREERDIEIQKKHELERLERQQKEEKYLASFEEEFADMIPLLKEAEIKYHPLFTNQLGHEHQIVFIAKDKPELSMDYSVHNSAGADGVKASWRYYEGQLYGNWSKEDFILFIAEWYEETYPINEPGL
jgi:hypothetical protein